MDININNYYQIIDYPAIAYMSLQTKAVYIAELDRVLEQEFAYTEPTFATLSSDAKQAIRYDFYDTVKRFRDAILDSLVKDRVNRMGKKLI